MGRRQQDHLCWAAPGEHLDSTPQTLFSALLKKKNLPGGLECVAQGCSSPSVSTCNPSVLPAAPRGAWPCDGGCQRCLGRLNGAF